MIRPRIYSLYKNTAEMVVQNVDLNHLLKVVSVRLVHCEVITFPFVVNKYLGGDISAYKNLFFSQTFAH